MNPTVKKNALNFGLLIGGISVLYYLMGYVLMPNLFTSMSGGLVLMLLVIVINIYAVFRTRKDEGGYLVFKDAFTTFFLTWFGAGLIGTVFNLLLFNVIDPEFGSFIQEEVIRTTMQTMERLGAPEEQIDELLEQLKNQNQFGLATQARGFMSNSIIGAILGLIVAALVKKNPPLFKEEA